MFTALEFAAENPEARVTAFFASPVPEFRSTQFLAAETVSGVRRVSPEELAGMQQDYLDYERGSLKKSLVKEFGEPLIDNARFDIAVGQGKPSKAILDFARDNGVDHRHHGLSWSERRRRHARVRELRGFAQRRMLRSDDRSRLFQDLRVHRSTGLDAKRPAGFAGGSSGYGYVGELFAKPAGGLSR